MSKDLSKIIMICYKKILYLTCLFSIFLILPVSSKEDSFKLAVTEDGKTVKLYENGKWEFTTVKNKGNEQVRGSYNKDSYIKNFYSSKSGKFNIYYDKELWAVMPRPVTPGAEFSLTHNKSSAYAVTFFSDKSLPLAGLKKLILANARKTSPGAQIIRTDYRIVNGKKFMFIELLADVYGVVLKYYYYIHSGSDFSIQFVIFSSADSFSKNDKEYMDLLNGIVIKN